MLRTIVTRRFHIYFIYILLTCSPQLHAEYLGLPDGRSANITAMPTWSIDTGVSSGEYDSVDYEHQGVRLGYKIFPDTLLFANLGYSSFSTANEVSYGGGLYYQIPGLMQSFYSAFKLSYNYIDLGNLADSELAGTEVIPGAATACAITQAYVLVNDGIFLNPLDCLPVLYPSSLSTVSIEGELSLITAELLLSSKNKFGPSNNIGWYSSVGIIATQGGRNDNTELTLGWGLTAPWQSREVFAGFNLTNDLTFGLGIRYNVR